jgi:hypothetical protein
VPSSGTCDLGTSASLGKYATLTRAASDVALRLTTVLTGFNNGDVCWLTFECYSTVKAVAGGAALYIDQISDSTHVFAGFGKFTEDIPSGSVWSQIFTYDAATIDPRLEIFAYDASGAKLGFGRGALLNLTQAGVDGMTVAATPYTRVRPSGDWKDFPIRPPMSLPVRNSRKSTRRSTTSNLASTTMRYTQGERDG